MYEVVTKRFDGPLKARLPIVADTPREVLPLVSEAVSSLERMVSDEVVPLRVGTGEVVFVLVLF